jgi:hypothetical protein
MKKTYSELQAAYDAKHVEIRDKFMSYDGPNADLVREVFQFAFSGVPFSSKGPEEQGDDFLIINDMRRAEETSNGVGKERFFHLQPETYEKLTNTEMPADAVFTWFGLLENMIPQCIWNRRWYRWKKRHEQTWKVLQELDLSYLSRHFFRLLPEGPPGPDGDKDYYRERIADDASATFSYLAENRAYNGVTNNFWEQLFGLYKKGLWPCGWQGVWPAPGRFIAWRRDH